MRTRWIFTAFLLVIATAALVSPVWADGPVNRTERAEVRFLEGMIDHHQMALDMAQDCLIKAAAQTVLETCQNIVTAQTSEIETMRGWLLVWYGIDYQPMSMMQQGDMMGGMMGGDMMEGGMMGNDSAMQTTPAAPASGGEHDAHHPGGAAATPAPGAGPMPGGMMMPEPAGMMGMMAWLNQLSGVEYEIAWLEAMIDHHDDALHMSERILRVTERPELQTLAQAILDGQTAEIEQMEALITELGA